MWTSLTHNMLGDQDQVKYFLEETLKGRIAGHNDIAGVILFLCSDDASYIHGETIHVDSGMICTRM